MIDKCGAMSAVQWSRVGMEKLAIGSDIEPHPAVTVWGVCSSGGALPQLYSTTWRLWFHRPATGCAHCTVHMYICRVYRVLYTGGVRSGYFGNALMHVVCVSVFRRGWRAGVCCGGGAGAVG